MVKGHVQPNTDKEHRDKYRVANGFHMTLNGLPIRRMGNRNPSEKRPNGTTQANCIRAPRHSKANNH